MTKQAHTPGPWETVGATRVWSAGRADGGAVAIVAEPSCKTSGDFYEVGIGSSRFDEAMANARLIASAPQLLEALQKISALVEEQVDADLLAGIEIDEIARAAIAQATEGK